MDLFANQAGTPEERVASAREGMRRLAAAELPSACDRSAPRDVARSCAILCEILAIFLDVKSQLYNRDWLMRLTFSSPRSPLLTNRTNLKKWVAVGRLEGHGFVVTRQAAF